MQTYPIYIGGEMTTTSSPLQVINPHTQQAFATTYLANQQELEKAILKAEEVQSEMKELPAWKRSQILLFIADKLIENKQQIAELLACEAAKPIKYALGEMDRAIQTFVVAAEETKRIPGEHLSIDWTPAGTGREGWVKHFPVGLVAGIAPFNFPLNLAVHKIAPAIATGCPIILKPASSTPLATLELAKIIDQSDLPKGAISILPMDRKTGNQMVTDERFKLLTFTGSPEVGWKMKNDAGKKKVVLELGGNAGLIISDSSNLKETVQKAVNGAFAYAGQVCIHTQRIYVNQSVFDEFIDLFIEQTEKLQFGHPLDENTDITAMINEWNAKRVEEWVVEAVKQGAKLLTGGVRDKAYMSPTVLTETTPNMKVSACEVFGPVVTIEKYNDFEQVVAEVNNSKYGLQAGVFTDRISEMNYAFNHLDVGGVIINDVPTFRVDHMPYGGIKDSGLGREGVKYAMHDMLEPKILVKNI